MYLPCFCSIQFSPKQRKAKHSPPTRCFKSTHSLVCTEHTAPKLNAQGSQQPAKAGSPVPKTIQIFWMYTADSVLSRCDKAKW